MDIDISQNHAEDIGEDEATLSRLQAASKNKISELQVQIQHEEKHMASLSRKLEILRRKPCVIHRLPMELLVRTFQALAAEDSTNIGKPLFVCKSWYQLIINTPTLWRRLWIEPTWDVHEAPRLKQYVECALRHSQNLLLDICMCLEDYELPGNVLRYAAYSAATVLDDEGMTSWFWLTNLDEYREFPMIEKREALCYQTFQLLVGDQGETLGRWRSFFFKCNFAPYDRDTFVDPFFQILHFPAPNLEVIDMPSEEMLTITYQCFLGISVLRKLCVTQCLPTSFATNRNPLALQELRTGMWHSGLTHNQISTFTNLRRLWLGLAFEGGIWEGDLKLTSVFVTPFTLPFLEELHVLAREKEKEKAIQVAIQAPVLKILGFGFHTSTPYPAFYQKTELPLYKNLKRLILSQKYEQGILEWVKKHKNSNSGLKRLSSFEVPIAVPSAELEDGVETEWSFVNEFRYHTRFF